MGEPAEMVDDRTFSRRVLHAPQPALVLFTAGGCLSCEFLARRLPALAPDLEEAVEVIRCPIETSPRTFQRYGVFRTPTLLLFKDGVRVASHVGPAPIPAIRGWVADAMTRRPGIQAAPGHLGGVEAGLDRVPDGVLRRAFRRTIVRQASRTAALIASLLFVTNTVVFPSGAPDGYAAVSQIVIDFLIVYVVSARAAARGALPAPNPPPGGSR